MADIVSLPPREWYVVNTYAGHEHRVKENLERRIETMNLEDYLFNIIVAEQTEIEVKNGKKVEKVKNMFPGYLFVEMIMTDQAWYVVRNTPGVTGFIGSSGGGAKPFPVAQEDIDNILRRIGKADPSVMINYAVNDMVKILDGPFKGMSGTVETINIDQNMVKVIAIVFGRETLVEVDLTQVEKIEE